MKHAIEVESFVSRKFPGFTVEVYFAQPSEVMGDYGEEKWWHYEDAEDLLNELQNNKHMAEILGDKFERYVVTSLLDADAYGGNRITRIVVRNYSGDIGFVVTRKKS